MLARNVCNREKRITLIMFISNVLSQSKTWIIFTQPIFNWSIFTQHIKRFVKMAKGYKVDIVYKWPVYKSKYDDLWEKWTRKWWLFSKFRWISNTWWWWYQLKDGTCGEKCSMLFFTMGCCLVDSQTYDVHPSQVSQLFFCRGFRGNGWNEMKLWLSFERFSRYLPSA